MFFGRKCVLLLCLVALTQGAVMQQGKTDLHNNLQKTPFAGTRNSRVPVGSCTYTGQLLPDDKNCTIFYICIDGVAEESFCPPNTFFNPAVHECDAGYVCPTLYNCTEAGVLSPNPDDCGSYYICTGTVLYPVYCEGQFFNEVTEQCEPKEDVKCGERPGCLYTGQSIPNYYDCQSFYICDAFAPKKLYCNPGMAYDSLTNECAPIAEAACAILIPDTTTPTTVTTTTPETATTLTTTPETTTTVTTTTPETTTTVATTPETTTTLTTTTTPETTTTLTTTTPGTTTTVTTTTPETTTTVATTSETTTTLTTTTPETTTTLTTTPTTTTLTTTTPETTTTVATTPETATTSTTTETTTTVTTTTPETTTTVATTPETTTTLTTVGPACTYAGEKLINVNDNTCRTYFTCDSSLKPVLDACPNGQLFDGVTLTCKPDEQVTTCEPIVPIVGCTEASQVLPDPYDCRIFYICNRHLTMQKFFCNVTGALVYDPQYASCNINNNICASNGGRPGPLPTANPVPLNIDCSVPGQPSADPVDCHKFRKCNAVNKLESFTCPPYLHFNPAVLCCDFPNDINC